MEPGPRGAARAPRAVRSGRRPAVEDEAERLEILDGGLDGQGEEQPFRGPARPERLELLAARPGVDPGTLLAERAMSADRASSATGPIRRRPKRVSRARTSASWSAAGTVRGEEGRPPPGGTRTVPPDEPLRPPPSRRTGPGDPRPDAVRRTIRGAVRGAARGFVRGPAGSALAERPGERRGQPLDEDRLRPPQRLEPVDLDLEQPEGGVERVGTAGDPRAESASVSKAASMAARSASGSGSTKVASGTSRWALPSGIPRRTPSARASWFASTTGPGSHGRPPRTSGPVGKDRESLEARARASSRGRCGR